MTLPLRGHPGERRARVPAIIHTLLRNITDRTLAGGYVVGICLGGNCPGIIAVLLEFLPNNCPSLVLLLFPWVVPYHSLIA
jgi:hypothetical protein